MTVPRFFGAFVAVAALGLITAAAAGLGPVTSAALGAGGTDVVAPPVTVSDVAFEVEWRDGVGFVVRKVDVEFEFTEVFSGRLGFYVALTSGGSLLWEFNQDADFSGGMGIGDTHPVSQTFAVVDIRVEDLDDIHVLVCDDVDLALPYVCKAP